MSGRWSRWVSKVYLIDGVGGSAKCLVDGVGGSVKCLVDGVGGSVKCT